jgi:hypothetical protein
VQESIGRRHPARHLLSPAQRALLLTAAGDGIDIGGLVVLGPVNVVRLTSGRDLIGDRRIVLSPQQTTKTQIYMQRLLSSD